MTQNCAIIDKVTRAVINVIVADPALNGLRDDAVMMVPIPDDAAVDQRWILDEHGALAPGPELAAEIEAERIAEAERNPPPLETDMDVADVMADPAAALDKIEGASG